jgi:Zn finger protein HypA/HybF involved in hydrogenase expression
MTMIRRATGRTGKIDSYTHEEDNAIVCKACKRPIVSIENLDDGHICPFCHNDVNHVLSGQDLIIEDDIDGIEDIAKPC